MKKLLTEDLAYRKYFKNTPFLYLGGLVLWMKAAIELNYSGIRYWQDELESMLYGFPIAIALDKGNSWRESYNSPGYRGAVTTCYCSLWKGHDKFNFIQQVFTYKGISSRLLDRVARNSRQWSRSRLSGVWLQVTSAFRRELGQWNWWKYFLILSSFCSQIIWSLSIYLHDCWFVLLLISIYWWTL